MSQQRIWDYYQSASLHTFSSAGPRLAHLVELASRLMPKPTLRVLNVGIGDATLEQLAQARGWDVHALDPSREAVDRCTALGVNARVGNIEALPYSSDSFDVVFCSEVFEHLTSNELTTALPEISRILVAKGHLIGTVPHAERLDDQRVICPHCGEIFHRWGHRQTFTRESLTATLSSVFEVDRAQVHCFIDWAALNWRGKGVAAMQKAFAAVGVHGTNANLVFVGRKRDAMGSH